LLHHVLFIRGSIASGTFIAANRIDLHGNRKEYHGKRGAFVIRW
jgi:hypothetical protein